MDVLSSRTIVHPRDLERSTAFYRDGLGLAVAREFGAGAARGTVFFAGGGLVEVVGARPDDATMPAGAIALWLQVRDVTAAVAELESRGVAVARPPVREPWGLVEAWVEDPDGIRVHLVEVPEDHPLRRDIRSL
jgi:predicted enzyme related to lactoylglutathione lyase